jgi:hypothetical protein
MPLNYLCHRLTLHLSYLHCKLHELALVQSWLPEITNFLVYRDDRVQCNRVDTQ